MITDALKLYTFDILIRFSFLNVVHIDNWFFYKVSYPQ